MVEDEGKRLGSGSDRRLTRYSITQVSLMQLQQVFRVLIVVKS